VEHQQVKSTGLRGSQCAGDAAGRQLSSQGTCPLLVEQNRHPPGLRSSPTCLVRTHRESDMHGNRRRMLPRLYRRVSEVLLYLPVASVSSTGCLGDITSRCGLGSGGEVVPALSVDFNQQPPPQPTTPTTMQTASATTKQHAEELAYTHSILLVSLICVLGR
jgi:hypothetical protein